MFSFSINEHLKYFNILYRIVLNVASNNKRVFEIGPKVCNFICYKNTNQKESDPSSF